VEPGTNPGHLFQQNTMRDAMIAGMTLNIFNNHSDRVRIANLAQTVNVLQAVILTQKEKMILTPTYHVMQMYNVHQDAALIPIKLKSASYQSGTQQLPAISASASRNSEGITHISLVNIDPRKPQPLTISLAAGFKKVSGKILTSPNMQDCNTFENPGFIQPAVFNGAALSGNTLTLTMPPLSVVVLALQ
jgi:alpha-N-arabinofuranosidase